MQHQQGKTRLSFIQSKISRHGKIQENTIYNKRQSIESYPKLILLLKLAYKDIKIIIIIVFHTIRS